jgi:hypothetical protein
VERKKHEGKKRYGVLLLITLINWLAIAVMVYFVDPETIKDLVFTNSYLPMVLLLSGGFFWIFSIMFMSVKSALRWTLGLIIFVYLRIWGMGSLFNGILIFGLLGSWELYWWKTKANQKIVAQSEE